MKVSVIAILLIVGQCQSFLSETATPPTLEETLVPAEDSLSLIAKKYEKDLAATGDCVIVFSKCNFQGSAQKICNEPNQALSFELPISSVYVPFGQQITIQDKIEGNQITFLLSEKCLLQSMVAEVSVIGNGEYSKENDGMPLIKQRFIQADLPDQSELQKKIEKDAEDAAIYNTPTEIKIDANVEVTVPEVKEPEVKVSEQNEKEPKGGLSPVQPESDTDSKGPKGDPLSVEKPPKGGLDQAKGPKGDNAPEPLTGNQ